LYLFYAAALRDGTKKQSNISLVNEDNPASPVAVDVPTALLIITPSYESNHA